MSHEEDRQQQALDVKIARALQIDVPELQMPDLPDIESDKVATLPVRRRSAKPIWFAVAATVVLATSISLRMSGVFESHDSLADEIVAHLDHEPYALRISDEAVSDRRLLRAIPASLAVYERGEALVTYAAPCIINGKKAPHLVVQGRSGPVTIILLPEEKIAETTPFDGDNVQGIIVPVGDGSIAIIGNREEQLEPIRKSVVDSVTWTT